MTPRIPGPPLLLLLAGALVGCADSPVTPDPEPAVCQRVSAELLADMPPRAMLAARRAALARAVGDGVVVLAAGAPAGDPQNDGYRGESSLYYLAGLEAEEAWLVVSVRGGVADSVILYLPAAQTTNSGQPVQPAAAVTAVRCRDALSPDVRRMVATGRRLLSAGANPAATDSLVAALRAQGASYADISAVLAMQRVVKDTSEIRRLRAAAMITAESIRDASSSIRAGRNEGDVAAAILAGFRTRGAMHASFPSIVAAGESALTLHYNANARPLGADELILMDVGAEYARYAGDVTRTYPVSGRFTERQRALYELVLGAQQAAIDAVAPGVAPATLNTVARDYLRAHSNGLCGSVTCDQRLIHSVWHWLGLNVHDVGPLTPLQPGMVLTIEPGIYLVQDSIGIRIEDDVLVTATGGEVLSTGAPRTVAEIEALLRAAATDFLAR